MIEFAAGADECSLVELALPLVPIKQVLSPKKGRPSTDILRQPFSIGGCFFVSTNLPAANAKKEANDVALLLLLKLFEVFEGTHFDSANTNCRRLVAGCKKEKEEKQKERQNYSSCEKESKADSTADGK